MPFLLTKYIYPLKEATKPFGNNIYFDNPRNATEIEEIVDLLKRTANPDDENSSFNENALTKYLDEFIKCNNLNINFPQDKDIYHKLASTWVIVRFDDCTSFNDYPNLLDDSYSKAIRILDFLCFLEFGNTYRQNDTFLLNDYPNTLTLNMKKITATQLFQNLFIEPITENHYEEDDCWSYPFPIVLSRIESKISLVKDFTNDIKFNYIAEQIYRLNNLAYEYDQIICLVSLYELIVAHKPDTNKFNVEESIKKMFINKTLLILYLNNSKIDTQKIKQELSCIYDIRSNIAHGNFNKLSESLRNILSLYKNMKSIEYINDSGFYNNKIPDEIILSIIVEHLKKYLKILLNKYLDDPDFMSIVKDI